MIENETKQPIVVVKEVKKSFRKNDLQELLVLDNVNLSLYSGEIVALLGTSGSGKSTLLRIISGLIEPSAGKVFWYGQEVVKPVPGLGMIFQHFALMPWLTVLQNVELGLEALGVLAEERRERALKAIDIVGMDGFESAYPRELSGGMQQRVGFARALVINPDALLLDEPFSALDILTAENLRGDLLDLWHKKKTNIKSMLLITHNIEEAVVMADRILIFGNDPGSIRSEISVKIPHPRNDRPAAIAQYVEEVYQQITAVSKLSKPRGDRFKIIHLHYRLPKVDIAMMTGLLEALISSEYKQKAELSTLAEELHLDLDELLPVTEVLEILHLAYTSEGEIKITSQGSEFAQANILDRKKMFSQLLLDYVPLARHVRRILDSRMSHTASGQRFIIELQDDLSDEAAEEVLTTVIDWARYAELFAYNHNSDTLSLEDPQ